MNIAADLDHHASGNRKWRGGGAGEQFARIDQLGEITRPGSPAGRCIPGVENSGHAECEYSIAEHEWGGVRTFRHFDGVLVLFETGSILLLPEDLAVSEVDGGDDLFRIAPAVDEDAA